MNRDLNRQMDKFNFIGATGEHNGSPTNQHARAALCTTSRAPGYLLAVLAGGSDMPAADLRACDQALYAVRQAFEQFSPNVDNPAVFLEDVAREAHTVIKLGTYVSGRSTLASIAALMFVPGNEAYWMSVGGLRSYRFKGPTCLQQAGATTEPPAGPTNRLLGSHVCEPEIAVGQFGSLRAGDTFLLCNNGIWPRFRPPELGVVLATHPPRQAAEVLIDLARARTACRNESCALAIITLAPTAGSAVPAKQSGDCGRLS